jgi:hypothetical protein
MVLLGITPEGAETIPTEPAPAASKVTPRAQETQRPGT